MTQPKTREEVLAIMLQLFQSELLEELKLIVAGWEAIEAYLCDKCQGTGDGQWVAGEGTLPCQACEGTGYIPGRDLAAWEAATARWASAKAIIAKAEPTYILNILGEDVDL